MWLMAAAVIALSQKLCHHQISKLLASLRAPKSRMFKRRKDTFGIVPRQAIVAVNARMRKDLWKRFFNSPFGFEDSYVRLAVMVALGNRLAWKLA